MKWEHLHPPVLRPEQAGLIRNTHSTLKIKDITKLSALYWLQ